VTNKREVKCERYAKTVCSNHWPMVTVVRREVKDVSFQRNGQRNPSRNDENPAKISTRSRSLTGVIVTTA